MTKTANVHYGLSAWSNSTFVLGQRCSTGGNAYQCITAGTSTSAPTGTSSNVDNGGAAHFKWLSAIDYTSVGSWQADTANYPLVLTQPYIVQLWNNAAITTTAGTAFFTLTGHTTTTSNTITIKAAPGESFRDTLIGQATPLAYALANGVTFQFPATAGGINYIEVDDSNVIFDGLQFKDPDATSNCTLINQGSSATNFVVRNCLIDGTAQAGGATPLVFANTFSMYNCLYIDRQASNSNQTSLNINSPNGSGKMTNVTFVAINSQSTQASVSNTSGASTLTMTNCVSMNWTGGIVISNTVNGSTVNHSVMSATSVGTNSINGTGNLFSKTAANTFISATVDFRPKGTSPVLDIGLTDSTDIPTTDDIAGTSRPQGSAWDAGAWELLTYSGSATGTSTTPGIGSSQDNSPASATGTSTAPGIGSSNDNSPASATGTSTTPGIGSSKAQSPGTATGAETDTILGSSQAKSPATATGTSAASATGSSQVAGVGSAAGQSPTDNAVSNFKAASPGTATGTSTTPGVGSSQDNSPASATGTSTTPGVGSSKAQSPGTATGAESDSVIGSSQAKSPGSVTGTSTISGFSNNPSLATATGTSTTPATGISNASSPGTTTGTSTATASGTSFFSFFSQANANGVSDVEGSGLSTFNSVATASSVTSVNGKAVSALIRKPSVLWISRT